MRRQPFATASAGKTGMILCLAGEGADDLAVAAGRSSWMQTSVGDRCQDGDATRNQLGIA